MKESLMSHRHAFSPTGSKFFTSLMVAAMVLFGVARASAAVTITDNGATAPTPGANDISQLSTTGDTGNPGGKNYYSNNGAPPGEEFTTGANGGGYTMTDVYVDTGPNGYGNGINGTTSWTIYIYSVSGTTATLLTEYSGLETGASYTGNDWLHFSGLSIPLAANTTYAYAISSGGSAYTGLENSSASLTGADALLAASGGGSGTVTAISGFNGVFDIGLSLGTTGKVSEQSGAPTPAANDVSQMSTAGGATNPNSKNYFSNNSSGGSPIPPGEQFTTPNSNPGGYTLTNLYVQTGHSSGNGIGALNPWTLYVFSVSGSTATLLTNYSGITGTAFTQGGWIDFANLSVNLAANSTYAYAVFSGSNPYTAITNSTATLSGANAVLITVSSGAITTVTGFNGVFDAGLSPIAAPGPPTSPTATPGNNQVTLSWTAPSGTVTGYDVYRSTTSGSGYTLLAAGTDVSSSPFTDTTAVNGTTYYYVITALNGALQSANSSQVSATPPRANEAVTWNGIQTSDDNWTLSITEGNWLGTGTTFFENKDTAAFNDDGSTGAQTVNLNATVTPASLTFDTTNVSYTISGSGAISGPTGVADNGTGTVTLAETGGDNFSGGIAANAGTLVLDNASSSITGGATIASGATLQIGNSDSNGSLPAGGATNNGTLAFNRTDSALIEGNIISGSGNVIQMGGGTVQLQGNNTFTGTILVTNNSTLQAGSATALGTTAGATTVANGSTLDLDFSASIAEPIFVQGTGVGGNGAIIDSLSSGDPTLSAITLTADATFGGSERWDIAGLSTGGNPYNLTVIGGAYHEFSNASIDTNLANITVSGPGTTFGDKGTTALGNPADTLEIQSGTTLQLWNNGSANVTLNKGLQIDSGATLQNGSGANKVTGPVTLSSGVCYLSVGSPSLALNGALTGSGVLDLENSSSGVLSINGNGSSFTGGAYVYGSELLVNGTLGSGVVCESGAILGGTGTISGLADVYGTLLPGTPGAGGTFNAAGGLTLETGATVTNDLSATVNGSSNSLVAVTGSVTVSGNPIVLNLVNGALENGVYPLITYTGSLNGSFGSVQTASPTAYTLTLTNITTTTPNEIAVIVFGTPSTLTWNDDSGDGEWNADGSFNWTNLVAHDVEQFFGADSVIFDDSITNSVNAAQATSTNIDIASGQILLPAAFTNNSTVNYTISGAGEISGGVNLVKAGNSTLTISNINNFSGGVTINGGTVQAYGTGGNTALGSGTPVINAAGTLAGMDADAFGYAANTAPTNIFINGGTVSDLGTASYRITMPNITFMGGTLTSAAGNTGDANGNYSTFGNGSACAITTLATNTTAIISAGAIGFGKPTTFTVAAGNVTGGSTPGVDLLVTSDLVPYGLQPVAKAGTGVMAIDNANSASWGDPLLVSAGTLQFGTANDASALVSPAGTLGITNNAIITFASSESVSLPNVISGSGNVVVNSGTGVLSGANTYTGNTVINAGTLSLSGSGSIAGSADIIIAGGATFDVSGLSSTFTLGSSQILSNSTSTATVNGNAATGSGILSLTYHSGTPSLSAANGTLTLSAGTMVNINNLGSALPVGSYTIIAAGSAGSVGGTAPSTVAVTDGGVAGGQPVSLQINSGALVLVVGSVASPATITGIKISGSTLTIMATNGADGGQFVLLESTNLMLPISQWTPVLTNNFDGSGDLSLSTNIINSNNPREFYLLQMP